MNTSKQNLELIKQTLWKWSSEVPQVRKVLAGERFDDLGKNDVELICDVLLKELLTTGLDSESEPTKKGLELEAAIDWIRSPMNKPRDLEPAPR